VIKRGNLIKGGRSESLTHYLSANLMGVLHL